MSNTERPTYSCYVIDDMPHSVQAMTNYVSRVPELSLIGSSTNPIEAIKEVSEGLTPDIILLDVEMPQISGIDLIDKLPKESVIILITGHSKYALDGFEKDVVDFLLKPISFERFAKAVEKAKKHISSGFSRTNEQNAHYVFIRPLGKMGTVKLKVEDIVYIEVRDHTVSVITNNEEHTINSSLKDFQSTLPENFLFRVHRSFLVNIEAIKSLKDNQVTMIGGKKIPLGITYRKDFLIKWNLMAH